MFKLKAGKIRETLRNLSSGSPSSVLVSECLTDKNIENYHIVFPSYEGLM